MNYKQMVLFEELIDSLSKGTFRLAFGIGPEMCTGEFRKIGENKTKKDLIHTEELVKDYKTFVAEDKAYFEEVQERFKGNVADKQAKLLNIIFNHVYVFLEEKEDQVNNYLTGYDGLEKIYNLYKVNKHYGVYLLNGNDVEPFTMFEVEQEEKVEKKSRLET